jgi:Tfp pilus assembly protein PilO
MINSRERLMLMVAIVLLGGIAFKFLIHDPQQAQYEQLVSARDAAAGELAKDQQIVARAAGAHQEYGRLRAYVATVEQKLPRRKEIPALLTSMEEFTKQIGVTLQSIRPGGLSAVTEPAKPSAGGAAARPGTTKAQSATVYSSLPVDIQLTGSFVQVVEYLKELRNFPRLIIVDSVSLSPQTLPKLGVTIRAEIYTLGTGETGGTH